MTRNNLASHISWLLSHKVTPPVGGHIVASPNWTAVLEVPPLDVEEKIAEKREWSPPQSPPRERQSAQSINVGQPFVGPAHPSSSTVRPRAHDLGTTVPEGSMARLSSASKPTRSGLMSQHQLATPASTTGSSSLLQEYATFLKSDGQCDSPLWLCGTCD